LNGFSSEPQLFDFLTVATRSPWTTSICQSKVSPGCKPRNSAMPSGTVALRLRESGRAIEVFDLSGMHRLLPWRLIFLPIGWQMSLYIVSCFKRYMTQQILTRKQRGDRIKSEDIEQLNSTSFFVRSQTGRSGYSVTKAGRGWSCDCPDYRYRQLECKHIFAVLNFLEEQRLGQKYRLRLWE
jgi:hypothetical protein